MISGIKILKALGIMEFFNTHLQKKSVEYFEGIECIRL
jgi:hypothetical protein